MSEEQLLHVYLQDHHAGAAAGLDLFRRVADGHSRPAVASAVRAISDEVEHDKQALEQLMTAVGARPSLAKDVPARAAEKLGQFKANNRLASRSPLSDLLELEALTAAVHAKLLGWKTLQRLDDPRLPADELRRLADRAVDQGQRLDELHAQCADVLHAQ